jgi:hypothetical protein
LQSLPAINDRRFFSFDLGYNRGSIVVRTPAGEERFSCDAGEDHEGDIVYAIVQAETDALISLPWISHADAALMFADTRSLVSEVSMAVAPLRSLCRSRQDNIDSDFDGTDWDYTISLVTSNDVAGHRPLLTLGIHRGSLQVTGVRFGPTSSPASAHGSVPFVSAPSYTYPIRKMALGILAPTAIWLSNVDVPLPIGYSGGLVFFFLLALLLTLVCRRAATADGRALQRDAASDETAEGHTSHFTVDLEEGADTHTSWDTLDVKG